ncbi:hypothetical protein KY327_02355 [Candidatus Woesearchaeota archaeon]|nr:hypothetical protein [Candidatus Woesearchaeota archaeon]
MTYYVRIDDPQAFRKSILESSKQVIGSLQANRKVQDIRRRKREALDAIREDMKEIALMVSKLNDLLPQKELRDEALREAEERRKKEAEEKRHAHEEAEEVRERKRAEREAADKAEEESGKKDDSPKAEDDSGGKDEKPPKDEDDARDEPVKKPEVSDEEKKLQDALANIEKKLSSLK